MVAIIVLTTFWNEQNTLIKIDATELICSDGYPIGVLDKDMQFRETRTATESISTYPAYTARYRDVF